MARVQMEGIVDYLSSDFKKVLKKTLQEVAPEAEVSSYTLFRVFKKRLRSRVGQWSQVPDNLVE